MRKVNPMSLECTFFFFFFFYDGSTVIVRFPNENNGERKVQLSTHQRVKRGTLTGTNRLAAAREWKHDQVYTV